MTDCAHCGELIYEGTYAERLQGPTVADEQLVAGEICWRHHVSGLTSCLIGGHNAAPADDR